MTNEQWWELWHRLAGKLAHRCTMALLGNYTKRARMLARRYHNANMRRVEAGDRMRGSA